jgi:hypothetical protein
MSIKRFSIDDGLGFLFCRGGVLVSLSASLNLLSIVLFGIKSTPNFLFSRWDGQQIPIKISDF